MENTQSHKVNYTFIWIMLGALMAVSVGVSLLGLPARVGALVIFAVAAWKAFLVARNYMHLRWEGAMIYAILLIPLALFAILFFTLFPDLFRQAAGGK